MENNAFDDLINSYFEPIPREYKIDPDEIERNLNYNTHKHHLPLSIVKDPDNVEELAGYIMSKY